jgi:predicted kinase
MVDGHGDLRLEHVVRFRGRISVLDCIEFNEALRKIDPLSDLAFLSMELEAQGRPDLAARLERAYLDHAPDPDAEALLPLYRAYRAHVRAKVDHQASLDPAIAEPERAARALGARRHLALAWSTARAGEPGPLIVMHGPAGVGKSALARSLAPYLRAELVQSDVVRRELAGMAPDEKTPPERRGEVYGAKLSARTYDTLLDRASGALRAGRAAILDATFLRRATRLEALGKARALGAPFAILDVRCPEAVVRERIERRQAEGTDPSEADWAVYREHVKEAEPFREEAPHVVTCDAGEDPTLLLMRLLDRLESRAP